MSVLTSIISMLNRAVTKISKCQVFALSRWGTEQPESSFALIFLLFPKKIAGVNNK